jgi:hypothetical protein
VSWRQLSAISFQHPFGSLNRKIQLLRKTILTEKSISTSTRHDLASVDAAIYFNSSGQILTLRRYYALQPVFHQHQGAVPL